MNVSGGTVTAISVYLVKTKLSLKEGWKKKFEFGRSVNYKNNEIINKKYSVKYKRLLEVNRRGGRG